VQQRRSGAAAAAGCTLQVQVGGGGVGRVHCTHLCPLPTHSAAREPTARTTAGLTCVGTPAPAAACSRRAQGDVQQRAASGADVLLQQQL
jgi:hypothetical protein